MNKFNVKIHHRKAYEHNFDLINESLMNERRTKSVLAKIHRICTDQNWQVSWISLIPIYHPPPLRQDMTQSQFLSGV